MQNYQKIWDALRDNDPGNEVLAAYIDTGITNARTEGYIRLVQQVKRAACGFRNLEDSRRRIRFHCTADSRESRVARLGGRPGR
ncbi:MAG: transposase [Gordonia sp. (in: high G+C Gram-positive bacteria)]